MCSLADRTPSVVKRAMRGVWERALASDAMVRAGRELLAVQRGKMPDGFFEAPHLFIVGCGHSGTSVLLAKLDNHSAVSAIAGESRFFQQPPARQARLLRQWGSQWTQGQVLAEKTPVHVRRCEAIHQMFPAAHVVAVCRHPLDVVASLYLRYDKQLERSIRRWLRDNRQLLEERTRDRVSFLCPYESFVQRPEETLRALQEAVGLPVEAGLSTVTSAKQNWYAGGASRSGAEETHDQKRQRQINQPVFDGRGKYKTILTEGQVEEVWQKTECVAVELGYTERPC